MKNRIISIIILVALLTCTLATPVFAAGRVFYDLTTDHWAYSYIMAMAEEGIINGYEDETFRPENTVLRCEFVKLLSSCTKTLSIIKDALPFEDVDSGAWYALPLMRVKDYVNYYTRDGKKYFDPYADATREDVATAVVKALGYEPAKNTKSLDSAFSDSSKISKENKPYIAVAVEKNIIKGYEDKTFRPDASLTRAEAATLLFRAFGFELPEKVAYAYPGTIVETFDSVTGNELTKTYEKDGATYYEYYVEDETQEYKDFFQYIQYLNANTRLITIGDTAAIFLYDKPVTYEGKKIIGSELLLLSDITVEKAYTALVITMPLESDGKPCTTYKEVPAPTLESVIDYNYVGTYRIGPDTAYRYDYGNDDEDTVIAKVLKYIELCGYIGWEFVSEENTAYGHTVYLEASTGNKLNIHLNGEQGQVWIHPIPAR